MTQEQVSKSRIYFEGWFPGNVKRLKNESFVMVTGVSNNEDEARLVDREQLIGIARKLIAEWADQNNASVDIRLLSALDQPDSQLEIVCPDGLYVDPFPLMLRCDRCLRLDYHQKGLSQQDAIERATRRIRLTQGRAAIVCGHNGCTGIMKQVPYVAIHRCGNLTKIDIPFASRRTPNLGYRDHSGSFLQSEFFNVDTGVVTDHSLQMACDACRDRYPRASKQGRPVGNPDCFHVHNIQYLCLKEDTGRLVSRISSWVTPGQAGLMARDVAEAVVSTLLGLTPADELACHLRESLEGKGTHQEDPEHLRRQLDTEQRSLTQIRANAAIFGEDVIQNLIATSEARIAELNRKLLGNLGRFSQVRSLFQDPGAVDRVGLRRRAIEAALLTYDFARDRDTLLAMAEREPDPQRKAAHQADAALLCDRYGIADISHYKQINVVMASLGYTRELARPNQESATPDFPPLQLMGYEDRVRERLLGKTIMYALPARTEALQIHLDPVRVLQWCVAHAGWAHPGDAVMQDRARAHAHLLGYCPALSMDPSEVMSLTRNQPILRSAPFHLLHTISHCLLGTIKRHTGYDEKGVMEYLMPMDLSIILYVTSVQNYTSGGLLTLFRHHLRQWFDDASNFAFNCIFDPICSDKGGSCSGCVQHVIGCETFNHGLSRCYIHGGKIDTEQTVIVPEGFWR